MRGEKMKRHINVIAMWLLLGSCTYFVSAEETTTITPASEAAEGLDLQAVCELFKESENLEVFEKSLNDPVVGVNNLDLDENGEVDFIRVVEDVTDDAHIIILQATLGEEEFQDVATIEIEKTGEDYDMQIQGNEDLYSDDYYVEPADVHIHTWPIVIGIYGPIYHPYRSIYYFGFYPKWWKPYRPVVRPVYHTRVRVYTRRGAFKFTRTRRVRVVTRVRYKSRSSVLVKKKVVRTPSGTKVVTKVKKPGQKPVVKKKVVKRR
jgi:hypothetical protein